MYDVYKSVSLNVYGKWSCRKERLYYGCRGYGYPWISIFIMKLVHQYIKKVKNKNKK